MSLRRQLYEQLAKVPGGDPVLRIAGIAKVLQDLPPEEVAAKERRLLALAIAMTPGEGVERRPGQMLEEFFAEVDEIERRLLN